jgi:nicotinate dehydrogenase subunit A
VIVIPGRREAASPESRWQASFRCTERLLRWGYGFRLSLRSAGMTTKPYACNDATLDMTSINLTVNGAPVHIDVEPTRPLLSVLRDDLGLRGSRFGCGTEQCGACMVLIDGEPAYSCAREVETVAGKRITTVEGLVQNGAPHPLQQAFVDEQAGQCGYCLSGILISAAALLASNTKPTRAEVAAALDRHLCRCGVHNRIIRAVQRAGAALD